MNPTALSGLATELGLKLDEKDLRQVTYLAGRKNGPPQQLLSGAAALVDLAGAVGLHLDFRNALHRLAGADGIYELAADRLLDPVRRHKQHVFTTVYDRLEKAFFGDEAKARHAVFIGHLMDGSLGYQASMLLLAAEDAGLHSPGAAEYRSKLVAAVGAAIGRRYPVHAAPDVVVRDAELGDQETPHELIVGKARRDEEEVQNLAIGKIPDLAVRIDRLRDRRLKTDVKRVLNQIRSRLGERAEQGWIADPEAYYRKVIEPAAEAARRAA